MNGFSWRSLLAAHGLSLVLALAPGVTAAPAAAQQVIVIGDDRGGLVGERARLVDRIRDARARVEIRGNICYSACTMYLGAENLCISPATTFGFHAPTRNGRPLEADSFEHWTNVMARHYSAPLRAWYLSTARYQESGVMELSGADLIRIGYPAC
jgi:hypothetical protein